MNTNKQLPQTIFGTGEVKGMVFTKLVSTDSAYIYGVQNDDSYHYECFLKKSVPVCIDFQNRVYSESETKDVYPKSKDFGVWAWTFKSLEKAKVKIGYKKIG